jgi:hypothetical protein
MENFPMSTRRRESLCVVFATNTVEKVNPLEGACKM